MEEPLFCQSSLHAIFFLPRSCYDYCSRRSLVRRGGSIVSLEITQRETNGLYLLALRGRLTLGEEGAGFRTTIDNLLAAGATRIVINLEHVHYVDSAGLGALIEAHRKIKAKGARLRLSNLGPNLRRALEIARLLDLFDSHPDESAALSNF